MQASLSVPLKRFIYRTATSLCLGVLKQQQQKIHTTVTHGFCPRYFCVSLMNRKYLKMPKNQGLCLSFTPSFWVFLPLLMVGKLHDA